MPNPYERSPKANSDYPFPSRDVHKHFADKAGIFVENLAECDIDQQAATLNGLQSSEITEWRIKTGQNENWQALMELHESWAGSMPEVKHGETIAHLGTFTTIAFIQKFRLLPVMYADFSETLEDMSDYNGEMITFFANEAWSNMHHTHPIAFSTLTPMVRQIAKVNEVAPDDESALALLEASAALPYLLASATEMVNFMSIPLKRGLPFNWDA